MQSQSSFENRYHASQDKIKALQQQSEEKDRPLLEEKEKVQLDLAEAQHAYTNLHSAYQMGPPLPDEEDEEEEKADEEEVPFINFSNF